MRETKVTDWIPSNVFPFYLFFLIDSSQTKPKHCFPFVSLPHNLFKWLIELKPNAIAIRNLPRQRLARNYFTAAEWATGLAVEMCSSKYRHHAIVALSINGGTNTWDCANPSQRDRATRVKEMDVGFCAPVIWTKHPGIVSQINADVKYGTTKPINTCVYYAISHVKNIFFL